MIESVTGPHFRFTQGWFWTTTHNIYNEWKIYMESHIASMDNVGRDCKDLSRWLLKVGMMEFVAGIWVYTNGLCLLRDFGL